MSIPREGTELGDQCQIAQQTSMIASRAESAIGALGYLAIAQMP